MKEGERFQTFAPKSAAIAKHVAYYYIHSSLAIDFKTSFIYYPHYRNGVTAYIDSDVDFQERRSKVVPSDTPSVEVLFSRNYDKAIRVILHGPFFKLGIAFQALGINHFIKKPLNSAAPSTVNKFDDFGDDFKSIVRNIRVNKNEDPTDQLDDFLESRLNNFANPKLSSALDILFNSDSDMSVQALSDELSISRKTLLRYFQKDLATSVKGYQNLIRFRNALNDYRKTSSTSFTVLALEHSYYDQPAFIKHFKTITGLTPRVFFQNLKQFGSEDTYWRPE